MISRRFAMVGAVVALAACSEEYARPTAVATAEASVATGAVVQLDASSSLDTDGRALAYRWRFLNLPAGSVAQLNDASIVNPSFTADVPGDYVVGLVVSNGVRSSAEIEVAVTAGPCGRQAPTVEAISASDPLRIGAAVQLGAAILDVDDAEACGGVGEGRTRLGAPAADTGDPDVPEADAGAPETEADAGVEPEADGDVAPEAPEPDEAAAAHLMPQWRMVAKPEGSRAQLNDGQVSNPSFVPDVPGDYQIELMVTDATGLQSVPFIETITVAPCGGQAPEVNTAVAEPAAPDVGALVRLLATASDADNDELCGLDQALNWRWTFAEVPAGSAAQFNDPGVIEPSFVPDVAGTYVVQLVVTDDTGRSSAPSLLTMDTTACHTAPPAITEVVHGPEAPGIGSVVQFSATVTDADADREGCGEAAEFDYHWQITGLPAGSRAALNNAQASNPSLITDMAGDYAVALVVTDPVGRTSPAWTHTFTASACGAAAPSAVVAFGPELPGAGDIVQLGATITDADNAEGCDAGQTFAHQWQLIGLPAGSHAQLNAPDAATPSFMADVPGDYLVRLWITDSAGLRSGAIDTAIQVSACGAQAPVAVVQAAPAVPNAGQAVQLTAQITDADTNEEGCAITEAFSYAWAFTALPAGSQAQLNDGAARDPSFFADVPGHYEVALVVTDRFGNSSPASMVAMDVGVCGTAVPTTVVTVAPDAPGTGALVVLEATASDADTAAPCNANEQFDYAWWFVAVPEGSRAELGVPTSRTVGFEADAPGDYTVRMVVTDSAGHESMPVDTNVRVSDCGDAAPTVQAIQFGPQAPGVDQVVAISATAGDADNAAGCALEQALSWHWQIISAPAGSAAVLNDTSLAAPAFMADIAGDYTVRVWVSDDTGRRSVATDATVQVQACGGAAPTVDAVNVTPNLQPTTGQAVQVMVNASDADAAEGCDVDVALTAHWAFVSLPAGSMASLNDASVMAPSFTPDLPGDYTLEVTVRDATGRQSAPVRVTVAAQACGSATPTMDAASFATMPAADAVVLGEAVALMVDANDADNAEGCDAGQRFTWRWWMTARPAGSGAMLDDASLMQPAFTPDMAGDYVFSVEITDGTGRSTRLDGLALAAADCGMTAPTAAISVTAPGLDANSPAAVPVNAVVQVSAEGSEDADGACGVETELRYTWQLLAAPVGAQASLSDAHAVNPWFVADQAGQYVVRLFVFDGQFTSEAAEFVINAGN